MLLVVGFYLCFLGSSVLDLPMLGVFGIALFLQAAMGWILSYGLNDDKGFKHIHLGKIGGDG